jgi:hypothetical protein
MRKALFALCTVLMFAVVARAGENPGAYFHIGQVEFTYPIAHVTATPWLWDFINSRASMAAETRLASFPRNNMKISIVGTDRLVPANTFILSGGAQTSEKAKFTPIGSFGIDFGKIVTNAPKMLTNFGIWAGHDFRDDCPNRSRLITDAGIKASIPLW